MIIISCIYINQTTKFYLFKSNVSSSSKQRDVESEDATWLSNNCREKNIEDCIPERWELKFDEDSTTDYVNVDWLASTSGMMK